MNILLVLFFAGLVAANDLTNPFTPALAPFKNGGIPTVEAEREAVKGVLQANREMFFNKSVPLADAKKKFIGVNGHIAEVSLTEGKLAGVDTLYQAKDVVITHNATFAHLIIPYKFTKLTATYNLAVQHNGNDIKEIIVGEFTGFSIFLDILINRTSTKCSIFDLKVTNPGWFDVKLQGNEEQYLPIRRLIELATGVALEKLFEDRTAEVLKELSVQLCEDYNSKL